MLEELIKLVLRRRERVTHPDRAGAAGVGGVIWKETGHGVQPAEPQLRQVARLHTPTELKTPMSSADARQPQKNASAIYRRALLGRTD